MSLNLESLRMFFFFQWGGEICCPQWSSLATRLLQKSIERRSKQEIENQMKFILKQQHNRDEFEIEIIKNIEQK